jgi:hypothetical protein
MLGVHVKAGPLAEGLNLTRIASTSAVTATYDFPMPTSNGLRSGLWRLCDSLEKHGFEIRFPTLPGLRLRFRSLLPYPLNFAFEQVERSLARKLLSGTSGWH